MSLTSVTETGGQNSVTAITSHVAVSAENDAPTVTLTPFDVQEGGSRTLTTADVTAADADTALTSLTYTLATAPTQGTVYIDANNNGVLDGGEALSGGGTFTHAQLGSGKLRYVHNDGEFDDSFAISVSDGQGGAVGPVILNVTIGEPFLVACLALRGIPSFSPCEIIDPGRRVDGKIDTTEASILQRGLG